MGAEGSKQVEAAGGAGRLVDEASMHGSPVALPVAGTGGKSLAAVERTLRAEREREAAGRAVVLRHGAGQPDAPQPDVPGGGGGGGGGGNGGGAGAGGRGADGPPGFGDRATASLHEHSSPHDHLHHPRARSSHASTGAGGSGSGSGGSAAVASAGGSAGAKALEERFHASLGPGELHAAGSVARRRAMRRSDIDQSADGGEPAAWGADEQGEEGAGTTDGAGEASAGSGTAGGAPTGTADAAAAAAAGGDGQLAAEQQPDVQFSNGMLHGAAVENFVLPEGEVQTLAAELAEASIRRRVAAARVVALAAAHGPVTRKKLGFARDDASSLNHAIIVRLVELCLLRRSVRHAVAQLLAKPHTDPHNQLQSQQWDQEEAANLRALIVSASLAPPKRQPGGAVGRLRSQGNALYVEGIDIGDPTGGRSRSSSSGGGGGGGGGSTAAGRAPPPLPAGGPPGGSSSSSGAATAGPTQQSSGAEIAQALLAKVPSSVARAKPVPPLLAREALVAALQALGNLALDEPANQDAAGALGVVRVLMCVLRFTDGEVQRWACNSLGLLVLGHERNQSALAVISGMRMLSRLLSPARELVVTHWAVFALGCACNGSHPNLVTLATYGKLAIRRLLQLLRDDYNSDDGPDGSAIPSDRQRWAASIIAQLALMHPPSRSRLRHMGAFDHLVPLVRADRPPEVIFNASCALGNLCTAHPVNQRRAAASGVLVALCDSYEACAARCHTDVAFEAAAVEALAAIEEICGQLPAKYVPRRARALISCDSHRRLGERPAAAPGSRNSSRRRGSRSHSRNASQHSKSSSRSGSGAGGGSRHRSRRGSDAVPEDGGVDNTAADDRRRSSQRSSSKDDRRSSSTRSRSMSGGGGDKDGDAAKGSDDGGKKSGRRVFVALYSYKAAADGELGFRKGDRIVVANPREGTEWWQGRPADAPNDDDDDDDDDDDVDGSPASGASNSKKQVGGFFPSGYVREEVAPARRGSSARSSRRRGLRREGSSSASRRSSTRSSSGGKRRRGTKQKLSGGGDGAATLGKDGDAQTGDRDADLVAAPGADSRTTSAIDLGDRDSVAGDKVATRGPLSRATTVDGNNSTVNGAGADDGEEDDGDDGESDITSSESSDETLPPLPARGVTPGMARGASLSGSMRKQAFTRAGTSMMLAASSSGGEHLRRSAAILRASGTSNAALLASSGSTRMMMTPGSGWKLAMRGAHVDQANVVEYVRIQSTRSLLGSHPTPGQQPQLAGSGGGGLRAMAASGGSGRGSGLLAPDAIAAARQARQQQQEQQPQQSLPISASSGALPSSKRPALTRGGGGSAAAAMSGPEPKAGYSASGRRLLHRGDVSAMLITPAIELLPDSDGEDEDSDSDQDVSEDEDELPPTPLLRVAGVAPAAPSVVVLEAAQPASPPVVRSAAGPVEVRRTLSKRNSSVWDIPVNSSDDDDDDDLEDDSESTTSSTVDSAASSPRASSRKVAAAAAAAADTASAPGSGSGAPRDSGGASRSQSGPASVPPSRRAHRLAAAASARFGGADTLLLSTEAQSRRTQSFRFERRPPTGAAAAAAAVAGGGGGGGGPSASTPSKSKKKSGGELAAKAREEPVSSIEEVFQRITRRRKELLVPFEALEVMNDGEAIGTGSFANVYHAQLEGTDVAVKELLAAEDALEDQALARIVLREVNVLRKMGAHPNIIELVGVATHESGLYIVTEFVSGIDVARLVGQARAAEMAAERGSDTSLPWQLRVEILSDVAKALKHLHDNQMLHRDIKPGNILVHDWAYDAEARERKRAQQQQQQQQQPPARQRRKSLVVAKLCDFGFARSAGDREVRKAARLAASAAAARGEDPDVAAAKVEQEAALANNNGGSAELAAPAGMTLRVGTDPWMAPEVRGTTAYDFSADVFSFGATVFQLVTLEEPPKRNAATNYNYVMPQFEASLRSGRARLAPPMASSAASVPGAAEAARGEIQPPPEELVRLACACVDAEPGIRPSFMQIVDVLRQIRHDLARGQAALATSGVVSGDATAAATAAAAAKAAAEDSDSSSFDSANAEDW